MKSQRKHDTLFTGESQFRRGPRSSNYQYSLKKSKNCLSLQFMLSVDPKVFPTLLPDPFGDVPCASHVCWKSSYLYAGLVSEMPHSLGVENMLFMFCGTGFGKWSSSCCLLLLLLLSWKGHGASWWTREGIHGWEWTMLMARSILLVQLLCWGYRGGEWKVLSFSLLS